MNHEDEDQEALEEEKHKDMNRSCLERALKSFIGLESFHRTNVLLGTAMGIFLMIGKNIDQMAICKTSTGPILELLSLKNFA